MASERTPAWTPDGYDIEGELGRGAMGSVLLARERATGRAVALKVCQAAGAQALERLRREGQVAAALDHPGIVRVHAAGERDGRPWIIYELVPGARSLSAACATLDLQGRVALVRDAARALGHAHARGVVHRDVKPDNLLVDAAGRVRVADFGLALAADLERLTQTGAFVGTPSYMAPEQLGQGAVGPATDVWALGVVLHEVACGELPFVADDLTSLVATILRASPGPLRALAPAVPADLEAVVLRALSADPALRHADGERLALDLDRVLAGQPVERAARPRAGLARGALLALPPVAALVVVGVAAVLADASAPAAPVAAPRPAGPAAPPPPQPAHAPVAPAAPAPAPPPPPAAAPLAGRLPGEPTFAEVVERARGSPAASGLMAVIGTGLPEGAVHLGRLCVRGDEGLAADDLAALACFRHASGLGSPEGDVRGGELLMRLGRHAEGEAWLARAADGPDPGLAATGCLRLADALAHLPGRAAASVAWLERGVALEDQGCMHRLANRLAAGDAVARDPARAKALFERAEALGDVTSIAQLGRALEEGWFGERDLVEARRRYQVAVDRGSTYGNFLLGRALLRGVGGPRDEAGALSLLEWAAREGEAEAVQLLAEAKKARRR